MAGYDDRPLPRGTSRRWEVILTDDERRVQAPRLRATDVRAQHRILQLLSEDDLQRMPLMTEGDGLARYKQYLDLHDPARADFLAEGTEVAGRRRETSVVGNGSDPGLTETRVRSGLPERL